MALSATFRGHVETNLGTGVLTSGPIPCVTGDALVIAVIADSYQELTTCTVTLSTGWGVNFQTHETFYGNVSDGAYAGVFAAIPVPSNGSPTITVTTGGSAQGFKRPSFDIWTVTGYDPSSPVIATGGVDLYGNPINVTLRSAVGPGNTIAIISAGDGNSAGTPQVTGSGIIPGPGYTQPSGGGEPGICGFSTAAQWTASDTNQSVVIDPEPGGTPAFYALAYMEFVAAPAVPTVSAGVDRTVERTKGIIRTAGEASDGGRAITARQWLLQSAPGGASPPVGALPAYGGDPKKVLLPNSVAGAHVIRYTATNSVGDGFDEATITVTPLRPSVNAGPDETITLGPFSRTATEVAGDNTITSRAWVIDAGAGAGTTIGTAAALSWTPTLLGQYTLRYTATSAAGTSDPSYATITVGVVGVPLNIGDGTVRIGVAIAFAGDLTDPDGSSWIFTEVTTDVRVASGIYLRHGRSDEASTAQPAMCRFTLGNQDGKYSLGGRSPYWPNVRQGTPVGIYIDTGSGFETVFLGYADGFTPAYSIDPLDTAAGRGDATVEVVASGALRRLGQGNPPVYSSMRRSMIEDPTVQAYWPCEDGQNAALISSAFANQPPMDFSGRLHDGSNPGLPATSPKLAASDVFDCSLPLPQLNDSEWYGNVPAYTATSAICLRFLIDFPDSGSNDQAVLIGLITTGDPSFWEVRYLTGGDLNIRAWRYFTTLILDQNIDFNLDGRRGLLYLELTTSGGNVNWNLQFIDAGANFSAGLTGTVTSATLGRAVRVQTNTDGGHVGVTMGHIAVRSAVGVLATNIAQLNAHVSDQVGERLFRITAEYLLNYTQIDGDVPVDTVTDQMGPQRPNTVLGILRECETCDQGILWDGIDPGIQYSTKRYRESRVPVLIVDVPSGQVAYPFTPLHDDANRRNRVTASRTKGASSMYEDTTGPLGSQVIGRYDDSLDVNVELDSSTFYYAGWLVHTGTIEGYRWPRLGLDLAANPDLIDDWVGVIPGDRIDVTGLDRINSSAPVEPISLGIEGFEQTITDSTWNVTINASPYYAWAVAQACAATGDTQEFGMRADTSGSTVTTLIAAGQASLSVTTSSGPLWTTNSDDFPLYLDVGAVRVRATACSGTSSPQTFTVDAMPVDRPAGTPVTVWRQPVLGL